MAVNSAAPGKQGHGIDANRTAARTWSMSHPILIDETGVVGKAYGERGAPQGGVLVEYVSATLADLAAGRPVRIPRTKAYGCGVKYAH